MKTDLLDSAIDIYKAKSLVEFAELTGIKKSTLEKWRYGGISDIGLVLLKSLIETKKKESIIKSFDELKTISQKIAIESLATQTFEEYISYEVIEDELYCYDVVDNIVMFESVFVAESIYYDKDSLTLFIGSEDDEQNICFKKILFAYPSIRPISIEEFSELNRSDIKDIVSMDLSTRYKVFKPFVQL